MRWWWWRRRQWRRMAWATVRAENQMKIFSWKSMETSGCNHLMLCHLASNESSCTLHNVLNSLISPFGLEFICDISRRTQIYHKLWIFVFIPNTNWFFLHAFPPPGQCFRSISNLTFNETNEQKKHESLTMGVKHTTWSLLHVILKTFVNPKRNRDERK